MPAEEVGRIAAQMTGLAVFMGLYAILSQQLNQYALARLIAKDVQIEALHDRCNRLYAIVLEHHLEDQLEGDESCSTDYHQQ